MMKMTLFILTFVSFSALLSAAQAGCVDDCLKHYDVDYCFDHCKEKP